MSFWSPSSFANPTVYRWQVLSVDPPKGQCFEMDHRTGGQMYLKKASQEKCRPPNDQVTTMWKQNSDGPGGRCFEVDKESFGSFYSKPVGQKGCEPQEVETHIIEGNCYLKGVREDGGVYLVGVIKERCKTENTQITFIPAPSGMYGRCVSKDLNTGETFNESLKKCRPDRVNYLTLDNNGESECYEVAKEGGPSRYIKKVNKSNCRPEETKYVWLQTEETKGQCYLLGGGPTDYREKVPYKECLKNFDTFTMFEIASPTFGRCFLVDSKTRGQSFKQIVPLDDCVPKKVTFGLIYYLGKPYCLAIDEEDPVRGYRKSASLKYCHDEKSTVIWEPDAKDPMKGRCQQLYFLGDQANFKYTKTESCRPKETIPFWYVESEEKVLLGKCYEVAKEGGPQYYVKSMPRKYCKPKGGVELKYFHPNEYEKGGCYYVDKETLGAKYSVRTADEKCKREMFPKKGP